MLRDWWGRNGVWVGAVVVMLFLTFLSSPGMWRCVGF